MDTSTPASEAELKRLQSQAEDALDEANDFNERLAALHPLLVAIGCSAIEITYNGYGDSGEVDEIAFYDANGELIPVSPWVDGAVLTEHATEILPGGWEINEGSYGTLRVELGARTVKLQHNWKTTSEEPNPFTVELAPEGA